MTIPDYISVFAICLSCFALACGILSFYYASLVKKTTEKHLCLSYDFSNTIMKNVCELMEQHGIKAKEQTCHQ